MAISFYKAQSAVPTCHQHENEELDMYCRTCGKRVCEKCAKTIHKDHDWTTVNKAANEVRRNTASRTKQARQRIAEMKQASTKRNVKDDIQRVRRMEKAMKDLIGQHADRLVDKLQKGASEDHISEEIKAIEKIVEFFEEGIKFAHDNVVLEMEEELRDIISHSNTTISMATGRLKYIEGKIVPESLEFMLGEVKEEAASTTGDQSHVSITEISTFTHGTEYIQCINLISEVQAWIYCDKATNNDIVNEDGQKVSERKIGTEFSNFTVIDKDHVYTHFGDKMIRRVSSSGVITDITSTAPLHPTGICAARAGGLLVCLCSGNVSEINQDSYGEVHHLDMDGKVLRKYPDKGDGKTKLFTRPFRIAQNINLDLCVADIIATDFTSRLVVLAVNGKKRFEYGGQKSLKQIFHCTDNFCDSQGRILLTDYYNHAVHVLSSDGEFVQFLLTDQSTLRYPRCLAVMGDKLWIGCEKGVIKVYQYNI